MESRPLTAQKLSSFSRLAALFPFLLGALVLFGWTIGSPILQSIWPGLPTMKPNTAICFLLSGVSLLLWHHIKLNTSGKTDPWRYLSLVAAGSVLFISSVTLSEYLFNWDSGLDTFFFAVPRTDLAAPGRMSAATAIEFILIATSLLLFCQPRFTRSAQSLAAIAFFGSLLVTLAFAFQAELVRVSWFSSVAVHTALGFLIIGTSMLTLNPEEGWVAVIAQDTNSARIGRQFLLGALLVLPLIALLCIIGQRNLDWYGTYFGIAILTVSSIAALSLLSWFSTAKGNEADAEIENLNRVYAVLSGINTLIIRVHNKQELYREACQIAHQVGGFPCVWIASLDRVEKLGVLVAWQGYTDTMLERLKFRLMHYSDISEADSLLRRAIDSKKAVVLNQVHQKITAGPIWVQHAARRFSTAKHQFGCPVAPYSGWRSREHFCSAYQHSTIF